MEGSLQLLGGSLFKGYNLCYAVIVEHLEKFEDRLVTGKVQFKMFKIDKKSQKLTEQFTSDLVNYDDEK